MPSIIKLKVSGEGHEAMIILNDPVGTNNPWSTQSAGVLSQNQGEWNQTPTAAFPLVIRGSAPSGIILQVQGINTYVPVEGMQGTGIHFGSEGLISDNAVVDVEVIEFS
jgi:hypothetical protein